MGSRILSFRPPKFPRKIPMHFETDIPLLLQATKKTGRFFNGKKGMHHHPMYEPFTKVGGFPKENLTQQGTLGAWQ